MHGHANFKFKKDIHSCGYVAVSKGRVEVITLATYIRKVLVSSFGNDINYPNQIFKGLCQSFQANPRLMLPIMQDNFLP